jgi:hypothetical protein
MSLSRQMLVRALAYWAGLLCSAAAFAQSGGGYDVTRSTIDGGGAMFSTGGGYRLGGTIGQPDAGALSGGTYALAGGFWSAASAAATPTATSTETATRVPNATNTPSPSTTTAPTTTPPPVVTATLTITPGTAPPMTLTATPSTTATAAPSGSTTPTPTPTPTVSPCACVGDCRLDGTVTIDEIVVMVNLALGNPTDMECPAADCNGDGKVTVDEIITAVNNALNGCSPP